MSILNGLRSSLCCFGKLHVKMILPTPRSLGSSVIDLQEKLGRQAKQNAPDSRRVHQIGWETPYVH